MCVSVSGQKRNPKLTDTTTLNNTATRHIKDPCQLREQGQSAVTTVKILICGSGNGAHVMSCVMSSKKDAQVNVLTVYQNGAKKWSSLMEENNLTVTFKSRRPEQENSIISM